MRLRQLIQYIFMKAGLYPHTVDISIKYKKNIPKQIIGNLRVQYEYSKWARVDKPKLRALKNHHKALDLAQQEGADEAIASSYLNIGGAHYQNGQVDQASDYFSKARDLFEKIGDEPSLAAIYLNLAETNMLRREFKSAKEKSQEAEEAN